MSCPVWKDNQPNQQCNSTGQQAGLDRQVLQGAPILPDTGELVPCLSVSPQPGRQVFCNKEAGSCTHPLPSHGNLEPSPYGAVVHLALPAPSSPTHFSLLPMTTLQGRTCLSSPQPRPWPVSRCCSRERFPKKQYSP